MSGWPIGILRLARYVSADTDGMQYMRDFRWSGYIVTILLWYVFRYYSIAVYTPHYLEHITNNTE